MDKNAKIGDVVKLERSRRGWSPAQLADALTKAGCPVNKQRVYRWEDGAQEPRASELEALAKVFDVTVGELFSYLRDEATMVVLSTNINARLQKAWSEIGRGCSEVFACWYDFQAEIRNRLPLDRTALDKLTQPKLADLVPLSVTVGLELSYSALSEALGLTSSHFDDVDASLVDLNSSLVSAATEAEQADHETLQEFAG
ncbi:MAG: helix-turn-helix domain-containing protein [Propionibacteriaceae bacterium]|nr:helix-turn-helix domain-containing protein [Propionibacteriaceae bacterium]